MAAARQGVDDPSFGEIDDEPLCHHKERIRFVGRYEEKFGLFARLLSHG
jgi:hypothetical protein